MMRFLLIAIGFLANSPMAKDWIHPGTLHNRQELDFIKTQISQGKQPWAVAWEQMLGNESLDEAPTPEEYIDASAGENSRDNARRAYGNALAWYITGNEKYAQQAINLLNAWSNLKGIRANDQQKLLQAAWTGSLWGPAADLMLSYPAWKTADVEQLRKMFRKVYYPLLITASTWNGNVDLTQIEALMAIAVFCEDEEKFGRALDRLKARVPAYFFLETDEKPDSVRWSNPILWPSGLTQETCRDNNHHAQFALSAAIGAAEIAWHQGVDVYAIYQERFTKAMELMSRQELTGNMQGVCPNNSATKDIYDTWEIAYHHYHDRQGISLPQTEKMIQYMVRSTRGGPKDWNIFYETLTHADLPKGM